MGHTHEDSAGSAIENAYTAPLNDGHALVCATVAQAHATLALHDAVRELVDVVNGVAGYLGDIASAMDSIDRTTTRGVLR